MKGQDRRAMVTSMQPELTPSELVALQEQVLHIHVSDALLDYVQTLVAGTRDGQLFVQGLSPRAALALLRVAKAHAFLHGRNYAVPEDVQAVFLPVTAHRLVAKSHAGAGVQDLLTALLERTPV
jgi:MoxR-like ATPase